MSNSLKVKTKTKAKETEIPKILVGIPANRNIPKETVASLLPIVAQVGIENVVMMQNAMINQCRDAIVKVAIQRKADYIFWIDDDMVIPPDALTKLLAHNKDICSGLYFGRGNYKPLLFDLNMERNADNLIEKASFNQRLDYPQDELFKVGAVGFGCVLTRVSILEAMEKEWGGWFNFIGGYGEDLSFGIRCADMGIETWVDPSVKCGHIGQIIVNENHWNAVKDNYK